MRRAGAEGRALCLGGAEPAPAPASAHGGEVAGRSRRAGSGAEGKGAEAVPAPSLLWESALG